MTAFKFFKKPLKCTANISFPSDYCRKIPNAKYINLIVPNLDTTPDTTLYIVGPDDDLLGNRYISKYFV